MQVKSFGYKLEMNRKLSIYADNILFKFDRPASMFEGSENIKEQYETFMLKREFYFAVYTSDKEFIFELSGGKILLSITVAGEDVWSITEVRIAPTLEIMLTLTEFFEELKSLYGVE